jgi:hypothetical protein
MDIKMIEKKLLIPGHPQWEEFVIRLSGPEGINTRISGDKLNWDCDHTRRMAFTRYILAEFGADVEASITCFLEQGWACDCAVVLLSDATEPERRV